MGVQYARGTRTSFALANWIRSQGYTAKAFPGPRASSLLLIPAAIDAGLGQLGKHGSLINRTWGSNLRLAGVTTDMPLSFFQPDEFGSDDFCTKCQVCTDACPPSAIADHKQWVRGVERPISNELMQYRRRDQMRRLKRFITRQKNPPGQGEPNGPLGGKSCGSPS